MRRPHNASFVRRHRSAPARMQCHGGVGRYVGSARSDPGQARHRRIATFCRASRADCETSERGPAAMVQSLTALTSISGAAYVLSFRYDPGTRVTSVDVTDGALVWRSSPTPLQALNDRAVDDYGDMDAFASAVVRALRRYDDRAFSYALDVESRPATVRRWASGLPAADGGVRQLTVWRSVESQVGLLKVGLTRRLLCPVHAPHYRRPCSARSVQVDAGRGGRGQCERHTIDTDGRCDHYRRRTCTVGLACAPGNTRLNAGAVCGQAERKKLSASNARLTAELKALNEYHDRVRACLRTLRQLIVARLTRRVGRGSQGHFGRAGRAAAPFVLPIPNRQRVLPDVR